MVTLNQVIREIKRFGASHGQLNTVLFCSPDEWLDNTDNVYPGLFFDYSRARKERNTLLLDFSLWVADRITQEEHNEAEVWSDSLLIATDLLSYLSRNEAPYTLREGASFTPFTEATGDYLAGHKLEFTLLIPFPYDRCIIPIKPDRYLATEGGESILTEAGQTITI